MPILDHAVITLLALMILVLLVGMVAALYWMIAYIVDDIHDRRVTRYQERRDSDAEAHEF